MITGQVLGKRDRSEEDTTKSSAEPNKKKTLKFNKKDSDQKEILEKYLVEPKLKFSDLGGLDSVVKQL